MKIYYAHEALAKAASGSAGRSGLPPHYFLMECDVHAYTLDPLCDSRWVDFIHDSPQASIFHTRGWLDSLQRTYGYQPVVFTTSPPTERLRNGLLFCRVRSWITGHRIVSVPFADHCEPLCDCPEELGFLVNYLRRNMDDQNWRYIEIRPANGRFARTGQETGFSPAKTFYFHKLDLRPSLQDIFVSLHRDSVQRRIRHAERAGLTFTCGRSAALLKEFYTLLVLTRRRHHLPPQPYAWFRNLVDAMGQALSIRLAYKDGLPIATVLTLQFRNTVYYKYAASDTRYHNLAAMQALLWGTIQESKAIGSVELDLGRSDDESKGLIAFKDHWTHERSQLVYWRYPASQRHFRQEGWRAKMITRAFAHMPSKLSVIVGRSAYRHIG